MATVATPLMTCSVLFNMKHAVMVYAQFEFCSDNPFEVKLRFSDEEYSSKRDNEGHSMDNQWVFARQLLLEGIESASRAGDGDVRVIALDGDEHLHVILVHLDEDGVSRTKTWLTFDSGLIKKFLEDSLQVAPHGSEGHHMNVDWDAELARETSRD